MDLEKASVKREEINCTDFSRKWIFMHHSKGLYTFKFILREVKLWDLHIKLEYNFNLSLKTEICSVLST